MRNLKGLILAGGESKRMGRDKASLPYQEKKSLLLDRTYPLLKKFCTDTYVSLNPESTVLLPSHIPVLQDLGERKGPIGGIYSALCYEPHCDWLVVACDMPKLDEELIEYLILHQNREKAITAYHNPETNKTETLCAIYSPSIKQHIESKIKQQYYRLKDLLPHCHQLTPPDCNALQNINWPEDLQNLK